MENNGYMKEMIMLWLSDLEETGFGYANDSDFDNEAELNEAMSAEVSFYQPITSKNKYYF